MTIPLKSAILDIYKYGNYCTEEEDLYVALQNSSIFQRQKEDERILHDKEIGYIKC